VTTDLLERMVTMSVTEFLTDRDLEDMARAVRKVAQGLTGARDLIADTPTFFLKKFEPKVRQCCRFESITIESKTSDGCYCVVEIDRRKQDL